MILFLHPLALFFRGAKSGQVYGAVVAGCGTGRGFPRVAYLTSPGGAAVRHSVVYCLRGLLFLFFFFGPFSTEGLDLGQS